LLDMSLFVGFFPQLVAGPIVRAHEFLRQLDRPRLLRWKVARTGLYYIIQGFFLKLVVADNIGPFLEKYWATQSHALATLLLTFLFSCQIFADFAGYSLIARGIAYLLGFRLPVNFNNPYLAMTFQEFWTRWHITLSQWLRDYLYIPMGGNRGSELETYRNLLLVMLIGGLWHGAAFHFIVWGGIHGVALVAEKALKKTNSQRFTGSFSKWGWFAVVQGTVLIAWLFFRSDSPQQAFWFLSNLLVWYSPDENVREMCYALVFTLPVIGWHVRSFLTESGRLRDVSETEKAFWGGVMFCLILTCYGERTGFIYFQF
ncbi:MAG TPA: MBOAT family protein, partial [Verrucomicrobiales bacterium]|nr:MBOAT family protein [Verrucomicrobiales bacterium]